MLALFINAAILIVAATTFHARGRAEVAEIGRAFELPSPVPNVKLLFETFFR